MTILKRLQMLGTTVFNLSRICTLIMYSLPVNGLTQLEELVKEKQYGEVAQTLSVSFNISSTLNNGLYVLS